MHRTLLAALVAAATIAACDRGAGESRSTMAELPPGHVPIPGMAGAPPLAPEQRALLDSGNAAFRDGRHDVALDFYQRVAQAAPAHAAPWFGVYMVGRARNDSALADSALRMVRERAPGAGEHPAPAPADPHAPPPSYAPHGTRRGVT